MVEEGIQGLERVRLRDFEHSFEGRGSRMAPWNKSVGPVAPTRFQPLTESAIVLARLAAENKFIIADREAIDGLFEPESPP